MAFPGVYEMADMAYDDNTGKFWQLSVSGPGLQSSSCIYELDPVTFQATGKKMCPSFPTSQRGLAYDPVSNTWLTGDFHTERVYQINSKGEIIGSVQIGQKIEGLAYNSGTGHLFVLSSGGIKGGYHAVYVYDAANGFLTPPTHFDIPGFNPLTSGAGFGYDCDGHLWISDKVDNEVFEVASGEKGWCATKRIPWLTISPAAGTLAKGDSATVTLDFNGTGQKAYTTSQAQLKLQGTTPYEVRTIPLTVHWLPQPVDLVLTGNASPSSVQEGSGLVYSLKVKNVQEAGHGSATETKLTYNVPAGASYVSGSVNGVTCKAPGAGSSTAPSAATSSVNTVICSLGTLAPGTAKTVTIAVTAKTAGTLISTFNVDAREPDSDSGTATLSLKTPVLGTADIGVSASNAHIEEGASGTIHVKVGNAGPDPATGVELMLSSGGNIKLQSASSDMGSCVLSANSTIDCDLDSVAAGKTVTVDIKAFGTQSGTTTITGQVTSSANDPNPNNNLVNATVKVTAKQSSGGSNGSGGGGSFGWLALAALLGLTFVSAWGSSRRR